VNRLSNPPTHIVLIGMMGVGKSTVGRQVARHLGRPFFDSDDEVVAQTGRQIADIFLTDGEPVFREIEAKVMFDLLSSKRPSVIAAAGGSILRPETRAALNDSATVVWMQAPVDVLVDRTARGTHRPALANDPAATLAKMEADRSALYAETADVCVDCTTSLDEVVQSIVAAVSEVAIQ